MPPSALRVHTEYVLVKSVGPKVLWAESRVQGTGEYFPPLQYHAKIEKVEPTPTTGVLLAPCHDEFRGSRSDYVRQVALATTTSSLEAHGDA
ncbi:uncharacterized protein TNCV_3011711 [Trichonephila clavipes]|nr:uncharacterized protein TNCV_3011711 [Trichonephila clavipes]